MQMSNIDVYLFAKEIDYLKDSRLQKIYQIARDLFRFDFYVKSQGTKMMLVELGKNFRISKYKFPTPQKPSEYCMYLRKKIQNSTLENIEQVNFDRILKFTFRSEKVFCIILELFSKGNLIVTDENQKILKPLKTEHWKDRIVKRGEIYIPPPQRGHNPFKISIDQFRESLTKKDVVRSLVFDFNLGSTLAEEICIRSKIEKSRPSDKLTQENYSILYNNMKNILDNLEGKYYLYYKDGEPSVFSPVELESYQDLEKKVFSNFNEVLDEYYSTERKEKLEEKSTDRYEKERKRIEKIITQQTEGIKSIDEKVENLNKVANYSSGVFQELEMFVNYFLDHQYEKDKDFSNPKYEIVNFDKKKKILTINLKEIDSKISIDINNSIFKNINKLYSKAKKLDSKKDKMHEVLKKKKKELNNLEKKKEDLIDDVSVEKKEKKQKKWYEKLRWMFSSEDFLIVGGKDATTNELLVKKYMEKDDIFVHSDIHGAPCVIIKTEGKKPDEETLDQAAGFGASYSKAWKERLGSMRVYWVYPDQVSKSAPSGEFLKKGAFAIKGKRNYKNAELKIKIGLIEKEDNITFISGIQNSLNKKTKYYVSIKPGYKKSGQIAKEIKHHFLKMISKEIKEKLKRIEIGSIQQLIPPGRSDIIKK